MRRWNPWLLVAWWIVAMLLACEKIEPIEFITCAGCDLSHFCGNSAIEMGEECDDGNSFPYDSCNHTCHLPFRSHVELQPHDDGCGTSVALASNTVASGCPDFASAHIFEKGTGSWTEAELTPATPANGHLFGSAVALKQGVALIGAPSPAAPGRLHVFSDTGGEWTEDQVISGSTGVAGDEYGAALAVDTVLVVGAPGYGTGGTAFVLEFTDGVGWHETEALTPPDLQPGDEFGATVATSGNTVIIGAPGYNNQVGTAWVFEQDTDGNWTQVARIDLPWEAGARGGATLSIFGDTLTIGAQHGSGTAVALDLGSSFTNHAILSTSEIGTFERFGQTVAAGALGIFCSSSNGVFLFQTTSTGWEQRLRLPSVAPLEQSLATTDDQVVIGNPNSAIIHLFEL